MFAPWAITPEKFSEIHAVYKRHVNGEKLDRFEINKHIDDGKKKTRLPFNSIDGIAIISIEGVIAKKMNLFMEISGGTSTQILERDFKAAINDPDVKGIILNIDSPGGAVDGTPEFANAIFAARGKKPIMSFSDGLMASAAVWIGAASDHVIISGKTVQVGSIGVVATHTDRSKAEEKAGIKTTEIVAGKFKRIASSHEPLTKEGRASIQEVVDDVFSVFVSDIAKFRGASEETVVKDMADGRVFMGQKAVKAGLVDAIMTFDELVSKMAAGESPGIQITVTKEVSAMEITKEMIAEKHPDIAKAFTDEGFTAGEASAKKDAPKAPDFKETEEYKALVSANADLKKNVEGLTGICKDQTKELSIIREKESALLAEGIANSVLQASSIPGNLHGKVKSQVDYHSFVKEDQVFEAGSEPVKNYTEAITTEVKDWEARLGKDLGVGLGSGKEDLEASSASEKEDAEYAKELARGIAGPIRSDQ